LPRPPPLPPLPPRPPRPRLPPRLVPPNDAPESPKPAQRDACGLVVAEDDVAIGKVRQTLWSSGVWNLMKLHRMMTSYTSRKG
jgi:hypothetical protein